MSEAGGKSVRVAWATTLAAMVVLSVWGRGLQEELVARMGREPLPWLMAVPALAAALAAVAWIVRLRGREGLLWIVLLVPFSILVPLQRAVPEERLHFGLFALLGFLTLRLTNARRGFVACLLVGFLDEVLQYFVPGRFFDWYDVVINAFSACLGGAIALVGVTRRP